MSNVKIHPNKIIGKMKPMQSVNNGPVGCIIPSQNRNNFEEYRAARIPYARNHDASEWIDYGGEFAVDVYNLFPDFEADPCDPANYEFPVTDALVQFTQDTGTEVYYRLGSRIEHQCKKYRTVMPRDFHKWAVICEHIIRHYTEGWANGFYHHIEYWEIWNEPELDTDETPANKKRTWSGTDDEFYSTVAEHLKKCFPHLKIGGPGIAHRTDVWMDRFLQRLTRDGKRIPLDFFSWHWYGTDPRKMLNRGHIVRKKLDAAGYTYTESHLGEWNYVANWGDKWIDTIKEIIGPRGAAFIAASMCVGQNDPAIDMMQYYEVAPTTMNGIFDFYTCKPIMGYWALYGFSDLYELGSCVMTETDDSDIYVTAAADGKGRSAALICYYTNENGREDKTVSVALGADMTTEIYAVDGEHSYELVSTQDGDTVALTMKPNTFAVLKSRSR